MKKNFLIFTILLFFISFTFCATLRDVDRYLYRAAKNGDLDWFKKLVVDEGANVNFKTGTGKTILIRATMRDKKRIVHYLLKEKRNILDVNAADENGDTALHKAAKKGYLPIVKMLLLVKAKTDIRNKKGETPLYLAAKEGHLEVVKSLVASGADISMTNYELNTPLHAAADAHHKKVVEFLFSKGASVRTQNKKGRMPIDDSKYGVKKTLKKHMESGK